MGIDELTSGGGGVSNPLSEDLDAGGNAINNAGAVGTEEAGITNETFIRARLSSDKTGLTAGSYVNAFDSESTDNRSEFNSSAQFNPDETGEYEISIICRFGSTSDADRLEAQVYNASTSTGLNPRVFRESGGSGINSITLKQTYNLTAGDNYELQVRNNDSSFDIDALDTAGIIKRSVVHP